MARTCMMERNERYNYVEDFNFSLIKYISTISGRVGILYHDGGGHKKNG